MSKTHTTLSIDAEVLRIAKAKYPQMISDMVEKYLSNLINIDLEDIKESEIDECENLMQEKAEEITKLKVKVEAMKLKQETEAKKHLEKTVAMSKGLKAAGILEKVGGKRGNWNED